MRFRVLGTLQVYTGERWSTIRAAQPRAVLAVLLARAGHTISADRLGDEIWGERPPRTAHNTVQGYVMRLRRLIGADANELLRTENGGYRLAVPDDELDAVAFTRLVEAGQPHPGEGRRPAP